MTLPRNEYPRPQFQRDRWQCLNGDWQFEIDPGDSGVERGLLLRPLTGRITVPFCPESPLSGVGNTDFLHAVWYRRTVTIPTEWAGCDVLLHFQAVDCDATVWIHPPSAPEPVELIRHRGGWTPFSASLRGLVGSGDSFDLIVRARDDAKAPMPSGKQSKAYANAGCHYTRTTGIWQTVWMEPVHEVSIGRTRITPDVAGRRFHVTVPLQGVGRPVAGYRVRARLYGQGGRDVIATAEVPAGLDLMPQLVLTVPEGQVTLWDVLRPYLYDLTLELMAADGRVVDKLQSYAGLRSVAVDGHRVRINGRSVFQRLVLDQGYYPDGILTAPSDEALRRDIELSIAAGFNGARLHQKVFEERFLYHADRLGYLCWGEMGDWGIDLSAPAVTLVTQWLEALQRDYSHPCIIGWCGLNETGDALTDRIAPLTDLTYACYHAAKAMDATRPVLDSSGWSHRVYHGDVFDCHDYEQDPARFRTRHENTRSGKPHVNTGWQPHMGKVWSIPYLGQPFMVSEFGGTWWNPDAKPTDPSWGYGDRPKSAEEVLTRFEGLCSALLQNPGMFGYCYTQLTDVYQEQNGLFTFDRRPKFDLARLHRIQTARAAIED